MGCSMYRGRRLTICVSVIAFIVNAVSAYLTQYLPNEWRTGYSFRLYSGFACGACILGLWGALKASSTPTTIFANHLLLDSLLSTLPRLALLLLTLSLPSSLCVSAPSSPSSAQLPLSPKIARHQAHSIDLSTPSADEDALIDAWLADHWTPQTCSLILWTLYAFFGMVVIGVTGAQWWAALRVREFAGVLGRRERRENMREGGAEEEMVGMREREREGGKRDWLGRGLLD
ncbi:hypothetical protein M501DRAFT_987111 [Patellaria atrata CBS 101060]|uniref:Uncharacterized protein n=1 Tax=Patellaria atrata CBS 101060 TaxID=1346257 RepID=A0A9P4VMP0_9PEZI|nr:hypothetical protein M501DRAFT_987111 [Patellaria atrata CBS 101060]